MTEAADSRKRWDTDERFAGVADASAFAAAVEALAELARRPGWVTEEPEEPEVHLVPHLRDAGIDGLQLVDWQTREDGVLAVSATYHLGASRGDIRRRAWALTIRGYQELVAHLATLTRNTVSFAGRRLEKLSTPTPEQRRVFDLLGKPIPLRLDGT